jgi:putative transcriptional regulator
VGGNPGRAEEKSKTKLLFLVARPSIQDPFFEKSVILMLPIEGEPWIVGLIVNKPTRLPLLKLFPESPALKNSTENAYLGGPVDMASGALIFHAPQPPKQAMLLYDDVYLSFDADVISERFQDPKPAGDMRLFLGRSQWAPAQLQMETLQGSWYSLRAGGEVIFERDSEHLWKRLHDRAQPPTRADNWTPQTPRT